MFSAAEQEVMKLCQGSSGWVLEISPLKEQRGTGIGCPGRGGRLPSLEVLKKCRGRWSVGMGGVD